LDESAHACTRSELRGASCEDWKSAFKWPWQNATTIPRKKIIYKLAVLAGFATVVLKPYDKQIWKKLDFRNLDDIRRMLKGQCHGADWLK
jgi:hypothetical protein